MQKPLRRPPRRYIRTPKIDFFIKIAAYIESIQLKSGAIPSNEDGSHDPWDHIESIMGLSFANKLDSCKLAFQWLIENQNIDGSWHAKYDDLKPIEKNKPTHFAPYIAVAALHFYKITSDKEFLKKLWPTIESAINFTTNLQISNGTIPWSIDSKGLIEEDYLLTGSSSILKSIECGLAISKILGEQKNIRKWLKCYELLSDAIKNPSGKFDLLKDRKRFSMDWYYPILSGCLNNDEKSFYIQKVFNDFYTEDIGIKCVVEEPWVTVAETSEFIISLVGCGDENTARRLLFDVFNISDQNGIPYMGWQYEENIFWPEEKPSWTSAALIIAADTVLNYSDASDLFIKNQSILY